MRMILRRTAFYLVTAGVAITLNFFIPRLVPGNPAQSLISRIQGSESKQAIAALGSSTGPDPDRPVGPVPAYWGQLLHGNLGTSPASIPPRSQPGHRRRDPLDLGLVGIATLISFVLGTALGVVAAWRRGSGLDSLLPALTFLQAAPYFFLAILLVALLGTSLHWFPLLGGYARSPGLRPGTGLPQRVLHHAVLPALTIVLASMAGWILGMRNMMVTTMDEDYVLLAAGQGAADAAGAQLRGPERAAAQRGRVLPGHRVHRLGSAAHRDRLLLPRDRLPAVQAVGNNDYPLLQGIFLIITFAVLLANLLADFVYAFLDPRTRQEA